MKLFMKLFYAPPELVFSLSKGEGMEIISLQNVSKQYNGKVILNEVNAGFQCKESVAFVGHNGCGKSTLLKIISKLVKPTSGSVLYQKPLLFHYIPEKFQPVAMTGREFLTCMGAIDGIERSELEKKIEMNARDFFISDLMDIPMKSLSKGTLQKVVVVQAFLKQPDVLLLDEPLSGQDTASQNVFINRINQFREQGVTILMSCHERRLVEAISEKVYTFDQGKLVQYQYTNDIYDILILENVKNLPLLRNMKPHGRYYSIRINQRNCRDLLMKLLEKGWELRGMEHEEDI